MKTIILLSHVVFDNSPYCSFVHQHAKALKKEGYNVIVFAILSWAPFVSILKKDRKLHYKEKKGIKNIDGVTVIYKKALSFSNFLFDSNLNLNAISYYLAIKRKIKQIAKKENILFVDAHTFKVEGYVAALLHKKMKLHATVTCHGTSLRRTVQCKNSISIISNIMNNLDYAICVSESLENELKKFGITNTKVIYNGINHFFLKEEGLHKDITVLTVGHLIPQKNIDLVIEAFYKICTKVSQAKLVIVGKGQEEKKLRQLVQKRKIEDKVTFTGQIEQKQVHKLMQKSQIFLLPSVKEGFGIVYPEAMYHGCITIGTKGEGIDGFIKNGINGFLTLPQVDEIAKLVLNICSKKYDLKTIQKNAYKASKMLTWRKNAQEYIKLFENERKK